jgi:hypothetical protein
MTRKLLVLQSVHEGLLVIVIDRDGLDSVGELIRAPPAGQRRHGVPASLDQLLGEVFSKLTAGLDETEPVLADCCRQSMAAAQTTYPNDGNALDAVGKPRRLVFGVSLGHVSLRLGATRNLLEEDADGGLNFEALRGPLTGLWMKLPSRAIGARPPLTRPCYIYSYWQPGDGPFLVPDGLT